MRRNKWLITIMILTMILSLCLIACSPKDNTEVTDGNSSGDNNSGDNDQNDDSSTIPDNNPVDPPKEDVEIDIDKEYIVSLMSDNKYSGINDYIGEYDFSVPEQITPPYDKSIQNYLGVANIGATYHFTTLPVLEEGAQILTKDIGLGVYRLYLGRDYSQKYTFNHSWNSDEITSLTSLAQTSSYANVLGNSKINTFVIDTYEFNACEWYTTVTENKDYNALYSQYLNTTQEFYTFAKYLLTSYRNKTFILTTSNGDIEFGYYLDKATNYTQKLSLINAYTHYLNARQSGITKAVNEVKYTSSKVYGCVEVNHISQTIPGVPTRDRLVDIVLPNTNSDLYSFADNYTGTSTISLTKELNYLASKVPNNNEDFKDTKNIILSFGVPSNTYDDTTQLEITSSTIKEAIAYGVQYVVYDSLFCHNNNDDAYPTDSKVDGYWLIRPQGNFTPMFWHLKSLVDNKDYLAKTPLISIDTTFLN